MMKTMRDNSNGNDKFNQKKQVNHCKYYCKQYNQYHDDHYGHYYKQLHKYNENHHK